MFTRILMVGAYLFLLAVLLPHTAWMFSLFEPAETSDLGWAGAIAFEITIAALTHFLAKELAAASDIKSKNFGERLKNELVNIPAFLLLGSIAISVVANWTHAYQNASAVPWGEFSMVRVIYSILFGAALPLCSFAYAYVLSQVYKKPEKSEDNKQEDAAMLALINFIKANPGRDITPRYLGRVANVDESTASKVIQEAVTTGILNNINGKV